jgi:hypothetical protein
MRKAFSMTFVLLAIAVAARASEVGPLSAQATSDAVAKWEYRVLTKVQVVALGKNDLAAGLNRLGDEGWELAATEPAFIFKRPRAPEKAERKLEEINRQLSVAAADVEMHKERVAWLERMAKKGYLSEKKLQWERQRLKEAEAAFDKVKRELKAFPTGPKNGPEKDPRRER